MQIILLSRILIFSLFPPIQKDKEKVKMFKSCFAYVNFLKGTSGNPFRYCEY